MEPFSVDNLCGEVKEFAFLFPDLVSSFRRFLDYFIFLTKVIGLLILAIAGSFVERGFEPRYGGAEGAFSRACPHAQAFFCL